MGTRLIRLRYDGQCRACAATVNAGERAWWDGDARTVRCTSCAPETSTAVTTNPPGLDFGVPGDQGARGELAVGGLLDGMRPLGVLTLHDRRVPGSSANIDHIVVAPSGVWMVDTKNYRGRIERRGWLSRDIRLYVDGKNRTKLATVMERQVDIVRHVLGGREVPIRAVLCFAGAEWGLFAKPFVVGEAWVMWPNRLVSTIDRAPSRGVMVPEITSELATCLRAA